MKKSRLIFYLIFAAFHIAAFIFSFKIQDFAFLSSIYVYIEYFKWISLIGIMLLAIDVIWVLAANKNFEKERDHFNKEINILKAKLFDLQESTRTISSPSQPVKEEKK